MNLNLICGALEVIERDYHIPNPLKRSASVMGGNLNARNVSRFYPKPQQEEIYYFISGFLGDKFDVSKFIKFRSLFSRGIKKEIKAYEEIHSRGILARKRYTSQIDCILGCGYVIG